MPIRNSLGARSLVALARNVLYVASLSIALYLLLPLLPEIRHSADAMTKASKSLLLVALVAEILSILRQYLANTSHRNTEEDWFASRVFASADEHLEHVKEAQPFFLLVDCFAPHEPWDPPRKYVGLYGDPDYSGREPTVPNYSDASWITDGELERMRALYAGEVTMTDAWLGRFLERVEDFDLGERA